MSYLTLVKQKYNELAFEYIRKFRYTRNRCYSLTLSDKVLVDLAYSGLLEYLKEKLDGHTFLNVSQLLQKALAQESRVREAKISQKVKVRLSPC